MARSEIPLDDVPLNGSFDAVTLRYSRLLFARYPQWQGVARGVPNQDGTYHMQLKVPRPIPDDPVGGLSISTADNEVTVDCGRHWHGHWNTRQCGDETPDETWEQALAFVGRVIAEDVVIVMALRDRRPLGATCVDVSAARDMIAKGRGPSEGWPSGANHLDLWSWEGTFDVILPTP